jgi:hypothetical protein
MRRLSSIKPGEKFVYEGKVCILNELKAPSNRRFHIIAVETGEEFNPFGKTFVEEYSEPEVEVVEEEETPYAIEGYDPPKEPFPLDAEVEDNDDETPF